jgi:hypothetical protein
MSEQEYTSYLIAIENDRSPFEALIDDYLQDVKDNDVWEDDSVLDQ